MEGKQDDLEAQSRRQIQVRFTDAARSREVERCLRALSWTAETVVAWLSGVLIAATVSWDSIKRLREKISVLEYERDDLLMEMYEGQSPPA